VTKQITIPLLSFGSMQNSWSCSRSSSRSKHGTPSSAQGATPWICRPATRAGINTGAAMSGVGKTHIEKQRDRNSMSSSIYLRWVFCFTLKMKMARRLYSARR
jgi:hypothetical protein